MPLPSLICTICQPKISEPELGQSQQQEIGPKPTENSTRPYLYEIPAHFTLEIKTKGYDIIGVNLFHFKKKA